MSPAEKEQQIRDDVRARHGLRPLAPVTTVRELQRQEEEIDRKLASLAAKKAAREAARPPMAPEPAPLVELPVACAVQAVQRPGFDAFNRGGHRWPSSAPTFCRATPRLYAELSRERMLSVYEITGSIEELDALPLLDVPADRRNAPLPPPLPAIGTEENALEAAVEELRLADSMLVHQREKIGQLQTRRDEATVALEVAFGEYNPADSSKKALASVESAKLRADALEHHLREAVAFLEVLCDHHEKQVQARDVAQTNLWRSKYGVIGWERANADKLERANRLSNELASIMAEVTGDVDKYIVPADVKRQAEAMKLTPPPPASPLAVGAVLAAFSSRSRLLPAVRAVLPTSPQERREALAPWLDGLIKTLSTFANANGKTRVEAADRMRIALRDARCPLDPQERTEVAAELELRQEHEAKVERESWKVEDPTSHAGYRVATPAEVARARELSVATSAPRPQVPAPNGSTWERDRSGPPQGWGTCP